MCGELHGCCVCMSCVCIYMCCMCVCCVCMYVYISVYLCLSVKILLFLFAVSIVSTFWGGTRRVSVLTKAHFINVFLHINKAAFRMMSFLPRCFVFVLLPGWCRFRERHLFHQGKTNSRVCCMPPCVLSTVFARLLPSGYWVLLTVWGRERGRWCLLSLSWILSLAPPTQRNLPLHYRPSLSLTELGEVVASPSNSLGLCLVWIGPGDPASLHTAPDVMQTFRGSLCCSWLGIAGPVHQSRWCAFYTLEDDISFTNPTPRTASLHPPS